MAIGITNSVTETFSNFYRSHYDLVSKFDTELEALLKQDMSEPEFYDDLVYKLRKNVGRMICLIN